MATRCNVCGAEIPDEASTCPHCEATAVGEDRITAHAPTERVGEIAASHGVVLHELTAERASLEEVFLELTGEPGERGG